MNVAVAAFDKHGNSVTGRLFAVLKTLNVKASVRYGLITPTKSILDTNIDLLKKQSTSSAVAISYSTQPITTSNFQFLQLDDSALAFEGKLYNSNLETAISEQTAKDPQHCETVLQTLLIQADGDYAFWMIKDNWLAAGRDPIGVQPLYYGENAQVAAVATNRHALWRLGIENPHSFPPGNLAYAGKNGFQFKPIRTLTFTEPKPISTDKAAEKLQRLLEESIRRRVKDLHEVAVAFSGGLDSSVVAFLAAKLGVKVTLLHVSLENQSETREAIEASEALDLPLQIHLFKDSDVEAALPKVVELIEEPDAIKAAIGLPFFWAAQKAAEAGFKVMLAGQGADELLGGYQRYVNLYCEKGVKSVHESMFKDVVNIHTNNLERDLKVTGYFDVKLRLPFASIDVVEFALSLPVECKMERSADTLRKLVLRKMALSAGMSASLVDNPKKAVQYSTGINDAIKRIAKKERKNMGDYIKCLFDHQKEATHRLNINQQ